MKDKKNGLMIYFISVSQVIVSIALTAIINNFNKNKGVDVRARASVANAVKLIGTVSAVDETERTLIVGNVQFATNTTNNLGTWKVTIPTNATPSTFYIGARVQIATDAKTFKAESHTLNALEITLLK